MKGNNNRENKGIRAIIKARKEARSAEEHAAHTQYIKEIQAINDNAYKLALMLYGLEIFRDTMWLHNRNLTDYWKRQRKEGVVFGEN